MSKKVSVSIELCREGAMLPTYANQTDAGMDIYAIEDVVLYPGETKIIPTGLKVAIPVGYEIQVRPRSGLSIKTPIRVANAPGTVDAGYRDEIGVILTNISVGHNHETDGAVHYFDEAFTLNEKGNKFGTYVIKKGDRIAQIVLSEVPEIVWDRVDSVKDIGVNRNGGFGSTGV